MKRRSTLFVTILFLLLLLCMSVSAADLTLQVQNADGQYETRSVRTVSIVLDGQTLESDIPAFIVDNRTLVPVRIVSENLGAQVTWKQDTRQVQIETGDTSITLTIGSSQALVNGAAVELYDGVPATMAAVDRLTRTMVPLRFVSEQLGAQVEFDNETSTVTITTAPEPTYDVSVPALGEDGVLTVAAAPEAQPSIFTLEGRVVVDFPGGVLQGSSFGRLEADGTAVAAVRYNQYDSGYDVSRVARVVLDLQHGASIDDLTISTEGGAVTVVQPDEPVEAPETPPEEEEAETPLVVLDAGHGGTDVGAPYNGYNEKDLVLPITLAVGELLEEQGCRVSYTRSDDTYVSLAARAEQANTQGADIFVSIHANAFPQNPAVNGLETYYLENGGQAQILAGYIHEAVLSATGANDRETRTANFYVLRHTDMPAVLVETGYMTNEDECEKLASPDYQQQIAQGVAAGILAYLESTAP